MISSVLFFFYFLLNSFDKKKKKRRCYYVTWKRAKHPKLTKYVSDALLWSLVNLTSFHMISSVFVKLAHSKIKETIREYLHNFSWSLWVIFCSDQLFSFQVFRFYAQLKNGYWVAKSVILSADRYPQCTSFYQEW